MPIPAAAAAAGISAGSNLASTLINAGVQTSLNKKTQKWNEKMYGVQRRDAISDRDYENQYNSPEAQMARLKAAGLNPNLVYGSGGVQQSSADARSSSPGSWNPQAPEIDLGSAASSGMASYFDAQIKAQNVDNLAAQNAVLKNQAVLIATQVKEALSRMPGYELNQESTRIANRQANELFDTNVLAAKENVRATQAGIKKTEADTDYTLDENERKAALQANTIQEGIARILMICAQTIKVADERQEIQARIRNLDKDSETKELMLELQRLGINPSDPTWMRVLGRGANRIWDAIRSKKMSTPVGNGASAVPVPTRRR